MTQLVLHPWASVPVDPDAATARRWATDELLDPVYHKSQSLLSRLVSWILDQLSDIDSVSVPGHTFAAFAVAALVLVALIVLWLVGPVRSSRRRAGDRAVLASDDSRTADQMRAAADSAAAAGNWSLAVVERFRAVVRGLEERTVLDERAGRTAHEAAIAAAARLPSLETDLREVGALFDDVAYGGTTATPDDDRRLRDLDAAVRRTRPVTAATSPTAMAVPR